MTTTSEQLDKLEHAFNTWMAFQLPVGVDLPVHIYFSLAERKWARKGFEAGYQLAKQETEQIMKLAKFGAMVAASHMSGDQLDGDDFTDGMLAVELLTDVDGNTKFVDGIESTIMEILK